ncbi:hypothetical protein [Oceanospirillum sediminis]|uniref:Uncharacterized protein n=1 Tax=Oceanospirillum sediminis TaxID=2760088 RepID=A0A839IS17_9GAMM|nr:hypothetical protein [Oceanospirillum sediminis]MBB1487731.1 hypothetical protein [Oceanospirillum sediminis]
MSVINRIEIANLLNKHGDVASPWEPKMRHLLLNLQGQSTAISMENGFGKTTLSDALIGMLSRDRRLMSNSRRKMSPSRVQGQERPWSHIRVEFRNHTAKEDNQDDLLAQAGEEVSGENWVFGMYGHSDGDSHFYYYQGTLEDCPVTDTSLDGKVRLYSNRDFLKAARSIKVVRPGNRDEWLESISRHISRKELEQLASFQKEGGADKSQIFNAIRPRPGEKPDQAFFYEVLAPQILAGATQGETDEGEEFIEEVIINSGQKVSELRHRIDAAEQDQQRAEKKVVQLHNLNEKAEELQGARSELNRQQAEMATSRDTLLLIAQSPLPGIPFTEEVIDDKHPALNFALLPGQTEPVVAGSLIAKLLNLSLTRAQAYMDQAGLSGNPTRRLLHHPAARWVSDRKVNTYPLEKTRQLISDSQSFEDDAARLEALQDLEDACDTFLEWDSNQAREDYLADQLFLHNSQQELAETEQRLEQCEQDKESLNSRSQAFIDNQSYYRDALSEGLFTEQELEQPDTLEKTTQQEADQARQQLSEHQRKTGQLEQVESWWQNFSQLHPDMTPQLLLEEKEARHSELQDNHQALQEQLQQHNQAIQTQQQALNQAEQNTHRLQTDLTQLEQNRSAYEAFCQQFPDQTPDGFIQRIQQEHQTLLAQKQPAEQALNNARQQLGQIQPLALQRDRFQQIFGDAKPVGLKEDLLNQERQLQQQIEQYSSEIHQLQSLNDALETYQDEHDNQTPAQWLEHAQQRYPQVLTELEQTRKELPRLEHYLKHLDTDPLAASEQEQQALDLLQQQGLAATPLHVSLTEIAEQQGSHDSLLIQKQQWLTQAAAFLFAPVLPDNEQASQAVKLLLQKQFALPVFSHNELVTCITQGQNILGSVLGYETLAVKAATDPNNINLLREQVQQRIQQLNQQQDRLQTEQSLYDPYGDAFALVEQAAKALTEKAPQRQDMLEDELAIAEDQLDDLQDQIEPEALSMISDYQHYLELGGDASLTEALETIQEQELILQPLLSRLSEVEQVLHQSQRQALEAENYVKAGGEDQYQALLNQQSANELELARLEEQLNQTQQQQENANQQRQTLERQLSQIFADGEQARLQRLCQYQDSGEQLFMANREQQEQQLLTAQETATRRARWNFQRIRDYLALRGDNGNDQSLDKKLAQLDKTLKQLKQERKELQQRIEQLRTSISHAEQVMKLTDELAMEWLEQLRELEFSGNQIIPLTEAIEDSELYQLFSQYRSGYQEEDSELDALSILQSRLIESLRDEQLNERGKELTRQEKLIQQLHEQLGAQLKQALSEARLFNTTEKARLTALESFGDQAISDLKALEITLQSQLQQHLSRVEQLKDSQSQVEAGLQERLSRIIADAAGNLQILKRVARNHGRDEGAHFDIQAEVIDDNAISEMVAGLLTEIETHQEISRKRQQQNPESYSEEKQQKELQELIRRRIYRSLFRNIAIRLRHTAIRAHGRLFSLNEQMSEGQREAVSLMWLVKLSEFAIERDMRQSASPKRKREQASRESVIILDGLFSKLSHKKLIEDSLESLRNTRGRFQMVGLIHNPNYENDPSIFPSYLVGSVIGGRNGQGGHVIVRDGKPDQASNDDRAGEASLFQLRVSVERIEAEG